MVDRKSKYKSITGRWMVSSKQDIFPLRLRNMAKEEIERLEEPEDKDGCPGQGTAIEIMNS